MSAGSVSASNRLMRALKASRSRPSSAPCPGGRSAAGPSAELVGGAGSDAAGAGTAGADAVDPEAADSASDATGSDTTGSAAADSGAAGPDPAGRGAAGSGAGTSVGGTPPGPAKSRPMPVSCTERPTITAAAPTTSTATAATANRPSLQRRAVRRSLASTILEWTLSSATAVYDCFPGVVTSARTRTAAATATGKATAATANRPSRLRRAARRSLAGAIFEWTLSSAIAAYNCFPGVASSA